MPSANARTTGTAARGARGTGTASIATTNPMSRILHTRKRHSRAFTTANKRSAGIFRPEDYDPEVATSDWEIYHDPRAGSSTSPAPAQGAQSSRTDARQPMAVLSERPLSDDEEAQIAAPINPFPGLIGARRGLAAPGPGTDAFAIPAQRPSPSPARARGGAVVSERDGYRRRAMMIDQRRRERATESEEPFDIDHGRFLLESPPPPDVVDAAPSPRSTSGHQPEDATVSTTGGRSPIIQPGPGSDDDTIRMVQRMVRTLTLVYADERRKAQQGSGVLAVGAASSAEYGGAVFGEGMGFTSDTDSLVEKLQRRYTELAIEEDGTGMVMAAPTTAMGRDGGQAIEENDREEEGGVGIDAHDESSDDKNYHDENLYDKRGVYQGGAAALIRATNPAPVAQDQAPAQPDAPPQPSVEVEPQPQAQPQPASASTSLMGPPSYIPSLARAAAEGRARTIRSTITTGGSSRGSPDPQVLHLEHDTASNQNPAMLTTTTTATPQDQGAETRQPSRRHNRSDSDPGSGSHSRPSKRARLHSTEQDQE